MLSYTGCLALLHSFKSYMRLCILTFAVVLLISCGDGENRDPAELLKSANQSISDGRLNEAIIQLKNALQIQAELPEARFLLGTIYLDMGNGELAEREFNSAQSSRYDSQELPIYILKAKILQSQADDVLPDVEKLIADSGNSVNPQLYIIRGDALLLMNKLDEAMDSYRKALAADKMLPEAYVGLSKVSIGTGDYPAAEKILKEALALDIEDARVYLGLGVVSFLSKDITATEEYFSKTLELAPYNRQAISGVIRARLSLGMIDEANDALLRLEKLVPNSPVVKYFRAYIAFRDNNITVAKPLLLEVLKTAPNHPESLLLLSHILFQENELEQVIEYLERLNQNFPYHTSATKLLAVSYVRQNSSDEAIKVLEKLLQRAEPDAQIYSLLGTAYLRNGQIEKGSNYLEKASEMNPDAAEIRTQLALGHMASGSADLAIDELESAVELNPKLVSADIMLIMAHINQKDFDSAIAAAENLRDKDKTNPIAYNLLGNAYAGKNDLQQAQQYFQKAIEVKSDFTPAMFNLAALELRKENSAGAIKQYESVLQVDENNARALIGMAQVKGTEQDAEAMLDYLLQARVADERSLQARVLLARYYAAVGDWKNHKMVIEEAIELSPDNPEVKFQYARSLRANGRIRESLQLQKDIAKKFPQNTNIQLEIGKTLIELGDIDASIEKYKAILAEEPKNEPALLALINLHIRQDDLDTSKAYLKQYRSIKPDSVEALISQGDIASAESNLLKAAAFYQQAYDKNPSRIALYRLVDNYRKQDDDNAVHTIVDEWLNNNPADIEVSLLKANLNQEQNDSSGALNLYEKLLQQDETNIVALNNLAWLYFQKGKPEAVEYAEKAYTLAPESAQVMDTLAWILLKSNKTERALGLLSQALSKAPGSAAIRYHYAYALHQSGDTESAREELGKALSSTQKFDERADAEELMKKL